MRIKKEVLEKLSKDISENNRIEVVKDLDALINILRSENGNPDDNFKNFNIGDTGIIAKLNYSNDITDLCYFPCFYKNEYQGMGGYNIAPVTMSYYTDEYILKCAKEILDYFKNIKNKE